MLSVIVLRRKAQRSAHQYLAVIKFRQLARVMSHDPVQQSELYIDPDIGGLLLFDVFQVTMLCGLMDSSSILFLFTQVHPIDTRCYELDLRDILMGETKGREIKKGINYASYNSTQHCYSDIHHVTRYCLSECYMSVAKFTVVYY